MTAGKGQVDLGPRCWRVASDGAEVAVADLGHPDAPALVLAHGAGSSARFIIDAFTAPLFRAGIRFVTYDLRGHGESSPARDPVDHALDHHADDLAAVVADLTVRGVRVGAVGGVSLGAHAAVRAVSRHGLRVAFVLGCLPAWVGRATPGEGPHAIVAGAVRAAGVEGLLARVESSPELPAWLRHTLLRDYRRHDPASLAAILLALDGGEAPTLEEIEGLTTAVLTVAWDDDPLHPAEVAASWVMAREVGLVQPCSLDDMEQGVEALGRAAARAIVRFRDPMERAGDRSADR